MTFSSLGRSHVTSLAWVLTEAALYACQIFLRPSTNTNYVIDLGERLGIGFQSARRQYASQQSNCAGFQFDTVKGKLRVMDEKLVKSLACLAERATRVSVSARF